jgi:hypothetical protein
MARATSSWSVSVAHTHHLAGHHITDAILGISGHQIAQRQNAGEVA